MQKFGQSGVALLVALVALIVLTVLGLSTMGDILTQSSTVRNEQFRQRVFYAANSELNSIVETVNSNPSTADDLLITGLLATGIDQYQLLMGHGTNFPLQTSPQQVTVSGVVITGQRNDLLGCSGESVGRVKVLAGDINVNARLADGRPNGGIRSNQTQRYVYCWP